MAFKYIVLIKQKAMYIFIIAHWKQNKNHEETINKGQS